MEKDIKMKMVLFVFFCILYSLQVNAQEYYIEKMSYPKKIKIGGQWKREHDKFDCRSHIDWTNTRQWLKVRRNNKVYKVTQTGFEEVRAKTLKEYIAHTHNAIHKGQGNTHYSKQKYYLFGKGDTLMFDARRGSQEPGWSIFAMWNDGDKTIRIPIKKTKNYSHYVITTDIFRNMNTHPDSIKLTIREEKEDDGNNVYTDVRIYYYPEK